MDSAISGAMEESGAAIKVREHVKINIYAYLLKPYPNPTPNTLIASSVDTIFLHVYNTYICLYVSLLKGIKVIYGGFWKKKYLTEKKKKYSLKIINKNVIAYSLFV